MRASCRRTTWTSSSSTRSPTATCASPLRRRSRRPTPRRASSATTGANDGADFPQAWKDKIQKSGAQVATVAAAMADPTGDHRRRQQARSTTRRRPLDAGRARHRAAVHRAPDDVGGARRRGPRHGRHALRPGRCAPAPLWPLYALPQPSALSPVLSLALADMQISANTSVKTIEGHVRLPFPCPALPTAPVSHLPPSANSTLATQNPSSRSPKTST